MADTNEKVEVKTFSEYNCSSCSSSNDEKDMSYSVLLQNSHMISLQCKKYKEKYRNISFWKTLNRRNQMKI